MSEFIQDYKFGRIVIDDETYTNDVILLNREVIPDWWRKSGHRLHEEDLTKVKEYGPDLLIVGTGNTGNMKVPKKLRKALDIEMEVYPTERAVKKYNQKLQSNEKIAGAFHLTC